MSSPNDDEETKPFELDPKLKDDLEAALRVELETSLELEQALRGDMGAVEFIWRSIADGTANLAERDTWMLHLAQKVVDDVIPAEAGDRPDRALRALGFTAVFDKHWLVKRDLDALLSFEDLSGGGSLTHRQLAERMQGLGHFPGKSPAAAMSALNRVLRKIGRIRKV
ncbi:hypothetical protein [Brevundimonas sp. TWP2-3-4b1]|uniref:hypothetical protein n=1 Tax=Brevundimonas sp. TWP2-3-4b1 TaxID=2804580 RepID=UPI003CE9CE52